MANFGILRLSKTFPFFFLLYRLQPRTFLIMIKKEEKNAIELIRIVICPFGPSHPFCSQSRKKNHENFQHKISLGSIENGKTLHFQLLTFNLCVRYKDCSLRLSAWNTIDIPNEPTEGRRGFFLLTEFSGKYYYRNLRCNILKIGLLLLPFAFWHSTLQPEQKRHSRSNTEKQRTLLCDNLLA